jgi:hypothetical protein
MQSGAMPHAQRVEAHAREVCEEQTREEVTQERRVGGGSAKMLTTSSVARRQP